MGGNSAVRLALKDYFTYEFTFCLFANFKNPSLSLSFLVDNGATVNLNGNQIFATTGGANFQLPASKPPAENVPSKKSPSLTRCWSALVRVAVCVAISPGRVRYSTFQSPAPTLGFPLKSDNSS